MGKYTRYSKFQILLGCIVFNFAYGDAKKFVEYQVFATDDLKSVLRSDYDAKVQFYAGEGNDLILFGSKLSIKGEESAKGDESNTTEKYLNYKCAYPDRECWIHDADVVRTQNILQAAITSENIPILADAGGMKLLIGHGIVLPIGSIVLVEANKTPFWQSFFPKGKSGYLASSNVTVEKSDVRAAFALTISAFNSIQGAAALKAAPVKAASPFAALLKLKTPEIEKAAAQQKKDRDNPDLQSCVPDGVAFDFDIVD